MYKILLACSTGMSTSILMQKMNEYAASKNIEVDIIAVSTIEARKLLEKYDIVLLGPQVRYELPRFKKIAGDINKPCAVINMMDYGQADGEKVLLHAIDMIKAMQ